MKRQYDSGVSSVSQPFTGIEVEHTSNYGKKTIFVPLDASPIKDLAGCNHVYLGANHTYNRLLIMDYLRELEALRERTGVDIQVTIEVPTEHAGDIIAYRARDFVTFVVSVRIPYVEEKADKIFIKIDDVDFDTSNSGVWVVPVKEMMREEVKTSWVEYSKDTLL